MTELTAQRASPIMKAPLNMIHTPATNIHKTKIDRTLPVTYLSPVVEESANNQRFLE